MTQREFQIAVIKIQNIVRKGEFSRAAESIATLVARILESGTDEMKAQVSTLESYAIKLGSA